MNHQSVARWGMLLSGTLVSMFAAPLAARAQGTVRPILNCVTYDPGNSPILRAHFGYVSTFDHDVTLDVGPDNYFSPGVLFRGQPEVFHPGIHDRVFDTTYTVSGSSFQITWFLNGSTATARESNALYCGQPTYRGAWDAATAYGNGELVWHANAFWATGVSSYDPTCDGHEPGYRPGGGISCFQPWGPRAPTFTGLTGGDTVSILEDSKLPPTNFTVNDEDNIWDLTFFAISSDPALIPSDAVTFGGWGTDRTFSVTPAANRFGTATITLYVTDRATAAVGLPITVNVKAVNDEPTISTVPSWITDMNVPTPALPFTVDDIDTDASALIVTARAENPDAIVVIEGTGTNRTVRVTPPPNLVGVTTIELTVSDGALSATTSFTVTARAVDTNARPTIADMADQTTTAGVPTEPYPVLVGDPDTPVDELIVFGTSSNPTLIPNEGIVITGTGGTRWLTLKPVAQQTGMATIKVYVSDGHSVEFWPLTLTVNPASPPPPPPPSARTYYLAEGATGPFFDLDVLLANPNSDAAPVTMQFLTDQGKTITQERTLPPTSRTTIRVDEIAGLEAAAVSTLVTSTTGRPIVVERTMRWDASGYGAHTEKATDGAATSWYFAEGSQGFFSTFFLLVNPQTTANVAHVTYFREGEPPLVRDYPLMPASRRTIDAGQDAELVNRSFGARVDFDRPGAAERAMYFGTTPLFDGGHESAGVTAPATHWFLAEGATGSYFTTYILLANPQDADASVTLTYLPAVGAPVTKMYVVGARQRLTRNIALEDPSLASAAVATRIESTRPIVAERTQYWPNPAWIEAHNSAGVTETGTRWGLAEGRVGGPQQHQTYILLANAGSETATVTLTFLRADGTTLSKTVTVAPSSRANVAIAGPDSDVPQLVDESFGTRIESTRPIAVERSMYSNANGITWAAGTNATATRLPN